MIDREITVDLTDGFVDLQIPVLSAQVSEVGEADLILGGTLFGQHAEIFIHIRSGLEPTDFTCEDCVVHALPDGVQIDIRGEAGFHFASSWARLYGFPDAHIEIPITLSCTNVALAGTPAKIADAVVKFKLFHETGSTDDEDGPMYFEMFLNVDLPSGVVELREKDIDFRRGVLTSFGLSRS